MRPKGRTPADEYQHRGEIFIEGRTNSWYEIELVNYTNVETLAVLSVDGVGVVDGESASYDSRGFVLQPFGRTTVPGWLQSSEQAAKFVFSNVGKSYAHQTGKGGNPGVIGAAFFPGLPRYTSTNPTIWVAPRTVNTMQTWGMNTTGPTWQTQHMASSDMRVASNTASGISNSVGTAWGESVDYATTSSSFQKASNTPSAVIILRYDSADNLQAMGIRLKDRYTASSSQAFPANSTSGYCKPPPVWVRNKT